MSHPKLPPAFVLGTAAILRYGDFFTDPAEQAALIDFIERTKAMYAGSLKILEKPYQILREKWNWNCDNG